MGVCIPLCGNILRFVEIQSVFCQCLQNGLNFFYETWHFWSKFQLDCFEIPILEIWNIYAYANCSYSLLHIFYKFLDMIWIWTYIGENFLINEVGQQWFFQFRTVLLPNLFRPKVNYMAWMLRFLLRSCKHCKKKSHVTTPWRLLVIPSIRGYI